jgi:mRNA interferase MazF
MPYSRGDVLLVLFPDSNLRTFKRRPVLVVQADGLNTGLQQLIVAMITSNMTRAGHFSRVTVLQASAEGRQMGLHTDSVIATDNLATVLDSEIDRAIGRRADMQDVDTALRHTL